MGYEKKEKYEYAKGDNRKDDYGKDDYGKDDYRKDDCRKDDWCKKDWWCGEDKKHKDHDWCCEEDKKCKEQLHTHEFEGSLKLAELEDDPHNHRFAGVTGEAIPCKESHIHKVFTRTDFFDNHFHFISRFTGPAICVGNGKHVHFVCGLTSLNDGHRHEFQFATLIEDPLSPTPKEEYDYE